MKSCGVIVEYNPFHNGHRYHLEEARKESQADVIVAVMSGNFLQRGEPAIIDKWQRAEEALKNGADLVIELPFAYAVQSADYFARGGVSLLHHLGVDALCFGTDSSSDLDYEKFGISHIRNEEIINQLYQEIKNNGQSYPQQMTEIYRKLLPEWSLDFSSPNHILGMGYAKENAKFQKSMKLIPIKRVGNAYHDEEVSHQEFASATSIRKETLAGHLDALKNVLPENMIKTLSHSELIDWEKAWPLLKYQLLSSTTEELKEIYQMVEGLEYRFKEGAKKSNSFNEFMETVKSKRYTWTRIQRLCLYVLLQIRESQIKSVWDNNYLRVLGFNDTGRQFLKLKKKDLSVPLITNINQKNELLLELDIQVGRIYALLFEEYQEQDVYKMPIYIKEE